MAPISDSDRLGQLRAAHASSPPSRGATAHAHRETECHPPLLAATFPRARAAQLAARPSHPKTEERRVGDRVGGQRIDRRARRLARTPEARESRATAARARTPRRDARLLLVSAALAPHAPLASRRAQPAARGPCARCGPSASKHVALVAAYDPAARAPRAPRAARRRERAPRRAAAAGTCRARAQLVV